VRQRKNRRKKMRLNKKPIQHLILRHKVRMNSSALSLKCKKRKQTPIQRLRINPKQKERAKNNLLRRVKVQVKGPLMRNHLQKNSRNNCRKIETPNPRKSH